MAKIKATSILAGIALLAIGYVGGAYIGFPSTDENMMNGDVSKVVDNEDDPDMLVMQEILSSDAEAQQKSIIATSILSSRIDVIDSLADAGVKVSAGNKNFEKVNKFFVSLKRKADSAKANFDLLVDANERTINGEKVDNFEDVSNNALLSFVILDNAMSNGALVGDMLDYAREAENDALASALAGWMAFCCNTAELKGNQNDMAVWQKAYASLSAKFKQQYDNSKKTIDGSLAKNLTARLIESKSEAKKVKLDNAIKTVESKGADSKESIGNVFHAKGHLLDELVAVSCNHCN